MLNDRNAARAQGHRFYLPDKPCRQGHTAPRYVSTGGCSDCLRDWKAAEREATQAANSAVGRGSRLFAYELHPDDHAAALAFCQALDLQRGRNPQAAREFTAPKLARFAQGGPVLLPPTIAAARARHEPGADVLAQHEAIRK